MAGSTCKVRVSKDQEGGEFANAFRVVPAAGSQTDCFLDFVRYSEGSDTARVVRRIRVPKDFVPVIHDRLGQTLGLGLALLPVSVPH